MRRSVATWMLACAGSLALAGTVAAAADGEAAASMVEGTTHQANNWRIEMPEDWNGTLLLFSHGFVHGPDNPARNRPHEGAEELLARGYALAGTSYRATGWSLEEAVPSQLEMLDLFEHRFGPPRQVLAYGESMGGLVTLALVERYPERIAGAMPLCASVSGGLGMMNQALDGAFVLATLVPVDSPPSIVGIARKGEGFIAQVPDEPEAVGALVRAASTSPRGRARLALAAALAQLPAFADNGPRNADASRIPRDDLAARQAAWITVFERGVFFPRRDQEHRARGNPSWNTGIDYTAQLALSGQGDAIREIYRGAGLDLDADLAFLAEAPRIAADPAAVAYMRANYVPAGQFTRPVLSMHTTGDPFTMVSNQNSLARLARDGGGSRWLRQAYVEGGGHCTFSGAEIVAGIEALDEAVQAGGWDGVAVDNVAMNRRAGSSVAIPGRFVAYTPDPFLRHCGRIPGSCPGEPAAEQ